MKNFCIRASLIFTLIINSISLYGVKFAEFDLTLYSIADFRRKTKTPPFPIVYDCLSGSRDYFFLINGECPEFKDLPQSVKTFIRTKNLKNIQCFEAYSTIIGQFCNYFTHTWAMDKMTKNRKVLVATSILENHNLEPINGEIGNDKYLIYREMSFEPPYTLDKYTTRFKIKHINKLADAWFISVYMPIASDGNTQDNQKKKTIIIHWYFTPSFMQEEAYLNANEKILKQYGNLFEALCYRGYFLPEVLIEKIAPQMLPVQ